MLEDAATRGRLVLGLYGDLAPAATKRFLEFVSGTVGQFKDSADGPSYASSGFEKITPGDLLEGGRIFGLEQTKFAGNIEYQYRSRLLPLRPTLESNTILHDRQGLLTKRTVKMNRPFLVSETMLTPYFSSV